MSKVIYSQANITEGAHFYRASDQTYWVAEDDIDELGVTLRQVSPWNIRDDLCKYAAIDWNNLNSGEYARGWNGY